MTNLLRFGAAVLAGVGLSWAARYLLTERIDAELEIVPCGCPECSGDDPSEWSQVVSCSCGFYSVQDNHERARLVAMAHIEEFHAV